MEYKQQVKKEHYSFEKYFFPGRWMSYWYQTKEITSRSDIKTILDIGPGSTFLKSTLEIHRPDSSYKSVDVANDIQSDYKGSATNLPFTDNSFDCVCAFQVLEHIKFEDFEVALQEMKRVSKKYVFISLPHFGPSIELLIKIPFIKRIRLAYKLPYHPEHKFNGQHYWEIGKRNYSVHAVRDLIKNNFKLIDEYIPFENQYHHFFILKISK